MDKIHSESISDSYSSFLENVGDATKEAMTGAYSIDCCIASTKILIEVFKKFKVKTYPLPVIVQAYNSVYFDFITKNKRDVNTQEEIDQMLALKAHSCIIGWKVKKRTPHKWVGHLACLVEDSIVMDISIDQASRPQHGICLSPIFFEVSKEFFRGKVSMFRIDDGPGIIYEQNTKNRGYLTAPDWKNSDGRHDRTIRKVISQLNKKGYSTRPL